MVFTGACRRDIHELFQPLGLPVSAASVRFLCHGGAPGAGLSSGSRVQLEAEEVQETFVGTPWHGPSGTFLFREEGTYTCKDFDARAPRGTWSYDMRSDGTLAGATTNYAFFQTPTRYEYFHIKSGRYYSARPDKPGFL